MRGVTPSYMLKSNFYFLFCQLSVHRFSFSCPFLGAPYVLGNLLLLLHVTHNVAVCFSLALQVFLFALSCVGNAACFAAQEAAVTV